MMRAIVLNWKTLACLVYLFAWFDAQAQCNLVVTNPPCQAGPVNLTAAAITAGSSNVGTLTYWMNPQATVAVANPAAVPNSGIYYIKNTSGSCLKASRIFPSAGLRN